MPQIGHGLAHPPPALVLLFVGEHRRRIRARWEGLSWVPPVRLHWRGLACGAEPADAHGSRGLTPLWALCVTAQTPSFLSQAQARHSRLGRYRR